MRSMNRICAAIVAGIAFVIASTAMPAAAVDCGGGDFWTYATASEFLGLQVAGTMTYTYEDSRSTTIGSSEYDVNVLSVQGSVSGSGTIIVPYEVSITYGGYLYVTQDGMGIVKDDQITWTNTTWGNVGFQWAINAEEEIVTNFSPPMMSGFDTETSEPGDTWVETITIIEEYWENGTLEDASSDEVTYAMAISTQTEVVETDAGAFDSLKITVIDDDDNRMVFWWSSDVGNFVQQFNYGPNEDEPSYTMVLTDFSYSPGLENVVLFIAIGGVVLVAALVVLALVMLRRRPRQPLPYQPGTPGPQQPPLPTPPRQP
ncbi:MAG: hypothetical protein MUC90_02985 [Thermoplasmata archaeon]|jgi:hypothetical protein|nr:hypothetical protein [Thermoplasmata archaeon]